MPASLSKSKAQKGRGASATEPQDGPWELLGTTSDELIDIGEKLQRSKKEQDRTLAVQVYIVVQKRHTNAQSGRMY